MLPTHFFFNASATTEIYTLSLHDALPIYRHLQLRHRHVDPAVARETGVAHPGQHIGDGINNAHSSPPDRKSTRLNSSHPSISYAVFCLKKKKLKSKEIPDSVTRLRLRIRD